MGWDDLRFVLETARSRSLAQASRRLGVNQTTVLRRVQSFQELYGVQLFNSRHQGYRLNNLGHEILHDLAQIEDDIINIERKYLNKGTDLKGVLRLSTPDILFDSFLAPALARFRELYPGIQVVVMQSYETLNLARKHTDMAIRMTNNPGQDLVGKRLGEVLFGIYEKRPHRTSVETEKNSENDWVGLVDQLSGLREARWLRENYPDANYTILVDGLPGLVSAARAGFGKAILPCFVGDKDSELSRIGEPMSDLNGELWLLYHKDLRGNPRATALRRFLYKQFSDKLFVTQKTRRTG